MEDQLLGRLQDIEALKQRLENENIYLQEEVNLLGIRRLWVKAWMKGSG